MTERDNLVERLQREVSTVGLTDNTEKVFRVLLLTNVMKMLITGRSKYDITRFMNTQSNRCGKDLLPVVREVYSIVKDVEL